MPFKDTNTALGIKGSPFQVGRQDVDSPSPVVEQGINLPWVSNQSASWVYYDCTLGVMLDSGIVVHNRLPQVNFFSDTLASADFNDTLMDFKTTGVNLKCRDQYVDIVQRMGHARYWFRLWGQALRLGYQIPIPGILKIGGVAAVPYDKNPQWAFNRIAPGGNYGGGIMWHAAWSLWYTTLTPPINNTIPMENPAAHIVGTMQPPNAIQAPMSLPDDDAQPSAPGNIKG